MSAAPALASPSPSVRFVAADAHGLAQIVIDRPDDRVNAIDQRMVAELTAAVAAARRERPRGIVVRSAKPGQFIAGADLDLVRDAAGDDLRAASRALQDALAELSRLEAVSVAAIGGPALGGGCEVALACDWRVAADEPGVRIGLVEIRSGLIPAGGGTQRLPRLVGLPRALELILGARQLSARRALHVGLVDELAHPALLERAAADRALRAGKRTARGGRTVVERTLTWAPPLRAAVLTRARKTAEREGGGHYPAPARAIEAIGTGLSRGITAGQAVEATAFGELAQGAVARELIRVLLLTLRQRRAVLEGLPAPRLVREIGIVGAGFMGTAIAQIAAVGGIRVRLRDVDAAAVARAIGAARALTEDAARKDVVAPREVPRVLARIGGGVSYAGFAPTDLAIEAVVEDLATKRRVVAELEEVLSDEAVIATNTSALPIAEIAAGARRPERVVGMHFFSPVHRMPLVEVVRPPGASEEAVATVVGLALSLGKTPIVVGDGASFYTTRAIGALLGGAFALLEEGARIDEVDRAMTAFGWPVGPFALVDEIGLPVALHVGETVARTRGDGTPEVLRAMVEDGMQGRRNGRGFYLYERTHKRPNPRVRALARTEEKLTPRDAAERLTRVFAAEARRCLDEGVLRSADEGDLGAILGLGFPPFLGGPFRYAATGKRA